MRAILFPGQGSQYVGMASDFFNEFEFSNFHYAALSGNPGGEDIMKIHY